MLYTSGWNQSLRTQTGSCCVYQRSSVCPMNGCAPVFLPSVCLYMAWAGNTHSDSTILFLMCYNSNKPVF